MWETWIRSLGWEDPLEKEMATHSSTLAWKIPWVEEHGRLQSMGLQRVGHDWATSLYSLTPKFMCNNKEARIVRKKTWGEKGRVLKETGPKRHENIMKPQLLKQSSSNTWRDNQINGLKQKCKNEPKWIQKYSFNKECLKSVRKRWLMQ